MVLVASAPPVDEREPTRPWPGIARNGEVGAPHWSFWPPSSRAANLPQKRKLLVDSKDESKRKRNRSLSQNLVVGLTPGVCEASADGRGLPEEKCFILFFCSLFDGNSKHFIHDLEGRSGREHKKRKCSCRKLLLCRPWKRFFGTVPKSECPQIVSVEEMKLGTIHVLMAWLVLSCCTRQDRSSSILFWNVHVHFKAARKCAACGRKGANQAVTRALQEMEKWEHPIGRFGRQAQELAANLPQKRKLLVDSKDESKRKRNKSLSRNLVVSHLHSRESFWRARERARVRVRARVRSAANAMADGIGIAGAVATVDHTKIGTGTETRDAARQQRKSWMQPSHMRHVQIFTFSVCVLTYSSTSSARSRMSNSCPNTRDMRLPWWSCQTCTRRDGSERTWTGTCPRDWTRRIASMWDLQLMPFSEILLLDVCCGPLLSLLEGTKLSMSLITAYMFQRNQKKGVYTLWSLQQSQCVLVFPLKLLTLLTLSLWLTW